MYKGKDDRGSITIEAAIVLPVFICIVISLSMLIKLVYIHDVMQHAIDEAANELAAYSYIYHISDLQEIDNSIQDNLNQNAELAEEHAEVVVDALDTLENVYDAAEGLSGDITSASASDASFVKKADSLIQQADSAIKRGEQLTHDGIDAMESLYSAFNEACKNPKKEAASLAWMLSKGIYSDAKTVIAVPIIKQTVKRHLNNIRQEDADTALKRLNVYNGFGGLDFYDSAIFDNNENIDIVVKYRVDLPLPIKILPDIYMMQRSTARAWLNGGDGRTLDKSSIWDLPNKQRGIKIEELYGGNLPYDFPVIDIYDAASKTGTSIKSINLNSKSYQAHAKLEITLRQYVDDLISHDVITYKQASYFMAVKKLIIVIPRDSINNNNKDVLEQIRVYGAEHGIDVSISEL